jgi:dienelactone hydrolase
MGLNRLGRMNFKSLLGVISKISLFYLCVIAFAIGSAQGVGIPTFEGKGSAKNIFEFWKGYDARKEPLKIQVVESWKTKQGEVRLVLYSLGRLQGSNKSASPVIAAYLGLPKGKESNPSIVHVHGGGQRANRRRVEDWMEMGYACVSINWGGKVLEKADTPNTDWDGLAAGFIRPGVTKADQLDHHNTVRPDPNTLLREPHPLNSSWNLISICVRRALTLLEQTEGVDPDKLGVEGHSMGGRSTVISCIDPRVKAASPSVGGSGYLYDDLWGLPGSARRMTEADGSALYRKCVSAQSHWPHVTAPILFLGATNDFNSPTEWVVKGMSELPPETERMLVLAPHLNHRFTDQTSAARFMWMEAHLKKSFRFPKLSPAELVLDTDNGIPLFRVQVDQSSGLPVKKVEIYYGYARDPRIRFWRSAEVRKSGKVYEGECPVFDSDEPLFAFANLTYEMPKALPPRPGTEATKLLTLSSEYLTAYPEDLRKSKTKPTERPSRLIDDFSRGWQDWYRLNSRNSHHWKYATRKIVDPTWIGSKQGELGVEIETFGDNNQLGVQINMNDWQGYTGRKRDTFVALVDLPKGGVHKLSLQVSQFRNAKGETMKDWDEATELLFSPANRTEDPRARKINWNGKPPRLAKLEWLGGKVIARPHPHQNRGKIKSGNRISFDEEFQGAIKDSVELEKLDEKQGSTP